MQPGLIRLESGIKVDHLLAELEANPQLWDQYPQRRIPQESPHTQMKDIWLRFADINNFGPAHYDQMLGPHESIWYEAIDSLPAIKATILAMMGQFRGEQLGGCIITKLPPKGCIGPHSDDDWHSKHYNKFQLILSGEGSIIYSGKEYLQTSVGDLYYLDDSQIHGVINTSDEDRIALIVCIRSDSPERVRRF